MQLADNKMPQQMAFHGVVCCLHRCQIVIHLWYVRQPINLPQAWFFDGLYCKHVVCNTGGPGLHTTCF